MRALIQRVERGMVSVASCKVGEIGRGYVIFLGIKKGDSKENAASLVKKILSLRLFSGSGGRMERTIGEERGEILLVPEITLYAAARKGRLDFSEAEKPERARELFEFFAHELAGSGLKTEKGIFGEHMRVEISNDGPVTVLEEA